MIVTENATDAHQLFIVLMLIVFLIPAQAQKQEREIFTAGSFSLNVPQGELKGKTRNGTGGIMYSLEASYTNGLYLRVLGDVTTFPLRKTYEANGVTINIKGMRWLPGLYGDVGFRKVIKDWSFYGFGGGGLLVVAGPRLRVRDDGSTVDYSPQYDVLPVYRVGFGFDLNVKPTFVPFLEFTHQGSFGSTLLFEDERIVQNIFTFGWRARIMERRKKKIEKLRRKISD